MKLESTTYTHQQFGEISKPKFKIVDWARWDDGDDADAPASITPTPDDPRTQVKDELQDEIPF